MTTLFLRVLPGVERQRMNESNRNESMQYYLLISRSSWRLLSSGCWVHLFLAIVVLVVLLHVARTAV